MPSSGSKSILTSISGDGDIRAHASPLERRSATPSLIARANGCSYTAAMAMRHFLLLAGVLAMIPGSLSAQPIDPGVQARIDRILKATPLIDGHNDLPEQLRENYNSSVEGLASGTDRRQGHPLMTDMQRLHQGRVGGQFWSVYIPSEVTGDAAIRATIEQIDIVKRL